MKKNDEKAGEVITNEDGSKTIPLSKAISVDGANVKALTMREPTVADQLAADAAGGTDSAKELAMFANLCGVAPQQLHGMGLRDYKKVQAVYLGFLE